MHNTIRRKIGFIVNPKSGTDRIKAIETNIEKIFDKEIFECTIHCTEFVGHATGLAEDLVKQGYEIAVAVGGDGTANEVAQGLLNSGTALALLPKGSGNGLARACRIPLQMEAALKVIEKGYVTTMDIGTINDQLFLSNTGTGLDSHVALACKNSNQRGLLMYIKNTVKAFQSYKPKTYEIEIDGVLHKRKAIMISIANGNEFGYSFKVAPTAKFNDGLLDIMIVRPLNIFTAGRVSFHAWWGNLHKYSKVDHIRAKSIKIISSQMDSYQIDGDGYMADGPLQIEIQHKVLNIIVP
jgi:diacylglycerol kinase (ATP)